MWDGKHYRCTGCGEVYCDHHSHCPSCHARCELVGVESIPADTTSTVLVEKPNRTNEIPRKKYDYYEFRMLVGERQMSYILTKGLDVFYIDGISYCDVSRCDDKTLPRVESEILGLRMRYITRGDVSEGLVDRLVADGAIFWSSRSPDSDPVSEAHLPSPKKKYAGMQSGMYVASSQYVEFAVKNQTPLYLFSDVAYADVSDKDTRILEIAYDARYRVITRGEKDAGFCSMLKQKGALVVDPAFPNQIASVVRRPQAGPVRPFCLKRCDVDIGGIGSLGFDQRRFIVLNGLTCYHIGVWYYVDISSCGDQTRRQIAEEAINRGLRYITERDVANGFVDRLCAEGAYCWDGACPNSKPKRTGVEPGSGLWHYSDFVPVGVLPKQICFAISNMSPLYVLANAVYVELPDDDQIDFERNKREAIKLGMRVLSAANIQSGVLSGLKSRGAKMWDPRIPNAIRQDFSVKGNLTIKDPRQICPIVEVLTNLGRFEIELSEDAPISVANFLRYVEDGHYDGTIFHRVIDGFVIQGGGYTEEFVEKRTHSPILNESYNGLKNLRGMVAMARMDDANSATCQFFINLVDNAFLDADPAEDECGYAVFGRVVDGMDVIDSIAQAKTHSEGEFDDVPISPIIIQSIRIKGQPRDSVLTDMSPGRLIAKVESFTAQGSSLCCVLDRHPFSVKFPQGESERP